MIRSIITKQWVAFATVMPIARGAVVPQQLNLLGVPTF
jgi:hypothetical protein